MPWVRFSCQQWAFPALHHQHSSTDVLSKYEQRSSTHAYKRKCIMTSGFSLLKTCCKAGHEALEPNHFDKSFQWNGTWSGLALCSRDLIIICLNVRME
jgi:hypothetical protein